MNNNRPNRYQPPHYSDYQAINNGNNNMSDNNDNPNTESTTEDHQNQPNVEGAAAAVASASAPPATEDNINMYENNAKLGTKKKSENNNSDHPLSDPTPSFPHVPDTRMQAPSYQKVQGRVGFDNDDPLAAQPDDEEPKTCRICLEDDDDDDTMIAPCQCRGGSKWVHRDCLDEWRLNERDRAFSQCTECLFEYYMQPVYQDDNDNNGGNRWRRARFCWNVSRDVCFGTLLLQLIIFALGGIILAIDKQQALPNDVFPVFANHPWTLYYLLGWFLLLVVVGLYGSVVLSCNGCSISKSIPQLAPPDAPSQQQSRTRQQPRSVVMSSGATDQDRFARDVGMESNTEFYRRARHRRRHRRSRYHHHGACCDGCLYYNRTPIIIYDNGGYQPCCCCGHSEASNTATSGDCDCCQGCGSSSSGNSGNNDCGEALLVILLIVAVVLAVIGFFVGVVITVIAFQRVVQRHIHLIQKRQLIQEYQVMDLQEYDLTQPLPTAPRAEDLEWNGASAAGPTPSAPLEPLPEKDVTYLQKMGLMG